MNQPASTTTPPVAVGKYVAHDGCVQLDEGKDHDLTVMMGIAYVDGFVFDPAMKTTTCAIAISPCVAGAISCMIRVPMSTLSNQKAICELLGERGIIVCHPGHASKYLIISASAVAKRTVRELVKTPRWVAQYRAFFTGKQLIASPEIDVEKYWLESSRSSPMNARGDLIKWRKQIGTHIVANPIVLAMTCVAITSIFLDRLGLGSSMYNFLGKRDAARRLVSNALEAFSAMPLILHRVHKWMTHHILRALTGP